MGGKIKEFQTKITSEPAFKEIIQNDYVCESPACRERVLFIGT